MAANIEAAKGHLEAERAKAQKRFDVFGAKKECAEREGTPKPTGVYRWRT